MGKSKGHRAIEEINVEYSQECGRAGDLLHKLNLIQNDLKRSETRMRELDLEAGAAHKSLKEEKEALKEAPPLEAEISDQAIIGDART